MAIESRLLGLATIIPLFSMVGLVHAVQPPVHATAPRVAGQAADAENSRDRWFGQLASPDPYVRIAAMNALAQQPLPGDLPGVIAMLPDADPQVRTAVIRFLGESKEKRAVQPLLARLAEVDQQHEKQTVIRALAAIGDPSTIDPLAAVIRQDTSLQPYAIREVTEFADPRIRDALFSRLTRQGPVDFNLVGLLVKMDDRRLVPRMIQLLANEQTRRHRAIRVLGQLRAREAVEPLARMIAHPAANDRQRNDEDEACAIALAEIADVRAIPVLHTLLDRSEDDDVLEAGIRALGKFGDTNALGKIRELEQHDDRQVRRAAAASIGQILLGANAALRESGLPAAVQVAREGLQANDPQIVVTAIGFLADHDGLQSSELLVPMVLDSRQDVRIAAITALINQSPPVLEGSVLEAVEGLEAKYKQDAARSLARSGDRRVLPLLGRITGAENEYVVRAVAEEMWSFGRDAIPLLCDLLRGDDEGTRRAAMASLAKVADGSALDALLAYGKSETDESAQRLLIRTLQRIGDPRSIPYLADQLDDPKQRNRRTAAIALVTLGWEPRTRAEQIRYLVATGQTEDERVPRAAAGDGIVSGEFLLNAPILTEIDVGTEEWPKAAYLRSIEFRKRGDSLVATVRGGRSSWPPMTIRSHLRLLDTDGNETASASSDIKWQGYVISVISRTTLELEIDLGPVDTEKVKRFQWSVDEVPAKPALDARIDAPVEAAFATGESIPIALSASRGNTQWMRLQSVRFDEEKSENQSRRTFKTTLALTDHAGLDADWRVWLMAFDEAGEIVGRSGYQGHEFSTRRDREREPEQRLLEFPFSTWRGDSAPLRIRLGLVLVAAPTGVEGNRVSEAVEHQVPTGAEATVLDDSTAEGQRSIAASGHATRFDRTETGKFLYASRYGSGYDPEDPVDLLLVDENAKSLWPHSFPYDRFGYRANWVDFKLPQPIPLKDHLRNGRLAIAIDPHAHRRKGVYFHYTAAAAGDPDGRGIVPGKEFFAAEGRNWMIRAYLTINRN